MRLAQYLVASASRHPVPPRPDPTIAGRAAMLRLVEHGLDEPETLPCEDCNGLGGIWERGALGAGVFHECRECEGKGVRS